VHVFDSWLGGVGLRALSCRIGAVMMQNRLVARLFLACLAAACLGLWPGAPALAFFQDPATGFAARAPSGFTVEQVTNRRQFDVAVGLNPTADRPRRAGVSPHVCEAGFKAASANVGLSNRQLSEVIAGQQWRSTARTTIGQIFSISGERLFTLQGYRGVEYVAQPKMGPNAENVRMLLSIVETQKGRVTIVCGTVLDDFQSALPRFRDVRANLNLPK
jgi:hypothetical protein